MLKKMDQFFAKATEMILDYNERQQKHHCVLEENKASHDPRFDHADKLMDITQGFRETCETQQRNMTEARVELNLSAREHLHAERFLEANRLHPEHNDDELSVLHSGAPSPTEDDHEQELLFGEDDRASRDNIMRTNKVQVDGLTNADGSVGEMVRPRATSRKRPSRGRLKRQIDVGLCI